MSCHDSGVNRWVPWFAGFTEFTPTIPKLYFNVDSQEQRIFALCKQLHKLICYADMLGEKINVDHDDIVELQELFEKFMESGFNDYYREQIEEWVNSNLETLYELLVRQVYFGLTTDGHFVAYIPDSWNDIIFDTGFDYATDTYGRLILRFNVDSEHEVQQTPYEPNSLGRI